ncbi:DUF3168 domain-containing protein [Thermoactinomyces sp. DSM 45892]|uniref:tail completion protein gp17 n=1 Tax=Thermoactinomyces sp. DSM 45892 TaxID=1882753 RepID=UPI00089A5258|nr:DUF3168 domain-containing protein [Thermoactinomyces sp. DSM 45892]SDY23179.1 Protein of unknown function [Thermoactinomyces sp. DSM 45892]
MIELQRFLVSQLKRIHPRVYLEWAVQGASFPYLVYQLPTSSEMNRREDFVLEVDVWDQPSDGSTLYLQTLTDRVDQQLNRLTYTDASGWNARFFRVSRLMIPDPDPLIRRRQLRYDIRTYRRDT